MTPLNWVDWALAHGPAQPGQRLVLLVLARHADKTGLAFPSEARLLTAARVGRATLYRALAFIVQRGFVKPTVGPRRQRAWQLIEDVASAAQAQPQPEAEAFAASPPMADFWQALGLPEGGHPAPAAEPAQAAPGHSPPPQSGEEQAMFPRCGNSPPALRLGDELAPAGGLPLAGLLWGRDRRWARLGLPAGVSA